MLVTRDDCLQAKTATKEAVNAREMGYLKAAKNSILDKVSEVQHSKESSDLNFSQERPSMSAKLSAGSYHRSNENETQILGSVSSVCEELEIALGFC